MDDMTSDQMGDDYVRAEVAAFAPPGLNEGDINQGDLEDALNPDVGDGDLSSAPALPASAWAGFATEPITEGISPKAIWAAAFPFVAGVVLLLLDKLVLDDSVPDEVWGTLLGAGFLAGGGAAAAKPGQVAYVRKDGGEL